MVRVRHMLRRDDGSVLRLVLDLEVNSREKQNRPKKT